ncbi:MAG TPA: exosortase/archaeosortase family protein [Bryobacteraceae bacterium]|jgi:exosortase|nr:exosortase/archaeosortase family protein [Bryobacteraceae bacterium]
MAIPLEHKPAEGAVQPAALSMAVHTASAIQALALGALLVVAFWPVLFGIYGSWFDDRSYMEHGILVVPAAAYMAWAKRDKLAAISPDPSRWWGVGLVAWGALQAVLGMLGQWVWVSRMAFLISFVGCIVLVYGFRMVKELTYPLCTLLLMIAPPNFVFERLTLQLQLLASRLGAAALEALGYSVLREGNVLEMVGIKLSVEEACSGIRSLVAIVFMCVLYNYFFVEKKSMRVWILLLAIPIAILGNAVRIIATGVAGQYNHAWVSGATHEAFGYVSVLVAAAGCIGVHMALLRFEKMREARHA